VLSILRTLIAAVLVMLVAEIIAAGFRKSR